MISEIRNGPVEESCQGSLEKEKEEGGGGGWPATAWHPFYRGGAESRGRGVPGARHHTVGGGAWRGGQTVRPEAGGRVRAWCSAEQGRAGVADPWAPITVPGGGGLNLFQIQNEFKSDSKFKLFKFFEL
jgi:hypothetical protein